MIKVDISNVWGQLSLPDLLAVEKEVAAAHMTLTNHSGEGSDLLPKKPTRSVVFVQQLTGSVRPPMCSWSSASAAATWDPAQPSS